MDDPPRADTAAATLRPGRCHLVVTANGRPGMHGWWNSRRIARGKFTQLVDEQDRPGVSITLTDEQTHARLTTWPDDARTNATSSREHAEVLAAHAKTAAGQ